MTLDEIEVVPIYWSQPDKVPYSYIDTRNSTCWNVCDSGIGWVDLWTINAWGQIHRKREFFEDFKRCYRILEKRKNENS